MKLDRIDFDILTALQREGRMSNKELAEANGISPSTCLERVKRLRRVGAISGYHAHVLPAAMGIGVQALISIRLRQHAHIAFDRLLEEMSTIQEVVNVYLLAGAQDLLIHVAVRDVAHLREVVVDTFTSRDDVEHIETSLIFEFVRSAVLPNYQLDDRGE
jgi:DNA-binding Lrp family transcriptional regulator